MSELILSNQKMPHIISGDWCIAAEPFFHADRILDFHVMIYVTDGVIYVTEEETEYAIFPGELLFLKKGLHHYGTKEIPKGTRWYFVHFDLEESDHLISPNLPLPKYLTGLENSSWENDLKAYASFTHSNEPMKDWYLPLHFFTLLTKLTLNPKKISKKESLADAISIYLSEHIQEPFSTQALEQHFYLSYKYMASVFKKEKQLTMQQYHTKLRMNAAGKLLRSTLLPICEIAEYFGYTDQLYFSRCFHAAMGMSPCAYRKAQLLLY